MEMIYNNHSYAISFIPCAQIIIKVKKLQIISSKIGNNL